MNGCERPILESMPRFLELRKRSNRRCLVSTQSAILHEIAGASPLHVNLIIRLSFGHEGRRGGISPLLSTRVIAVAKIAFTVKST